MKQFEYLEVDYINHQTEKSLNDLGSKGWKLIDTNWRHGKYPSSSLLFMREKKEQSRD